MIIVVIMILQRSKVKLERSINFFTPYNHYNKNNKMKNNNKNNVIIIKKTKTN